MALSYDVTVPGRHQKSGEGTIKHMSREVRQRWGVFITTIITYTEHTLYTLYSVCQVCDYS